MLDVNNEVEKPYQKRPNASPPMSTEDGAKRGHSVEVQLAFMAEA